MSIEKLIAERITASRENKGSISAPIVKAGITGISLGIVVMLLTVSIVPGFKKEIIAKITGLTAHITISHVNVNPGAEQQAMHLGADTLDRLRQIKGIKRISPCAFKNGLLKTESENEGVLLKGLGADYDMHFYARYLVDGRMPDFSGREASNELLVSKALAERLRLKPGDRIEAHFLSSYQSLDSTVMETVTKTSHRSRRFTVCGLFNSGFSDFDQNLAIVDIRQLQRVNFWEPGQVGCYEITLDNFTNLEATAEQVREVIGYGYSAITVNEQYSNLFVWLDKLDVNGIIVIVLMIAVALMNMITALLILILERSNMIGLMKALGMPNADVRKVFFRISMYLTGRGLLWGNITGIALCLLQYQFKLVGLDSATYYVDFVAVDLNWLRYLMLNGGTILVCALMLYLPTFIVTRMTPLRTLKLD